MWVGAGLVKEEEKLRVSIRPPASYPLKLETKCHFFADSCLRAACELACRRGSAA